MSMNPAIRQAIIGVSGIAIISKLVGFLREMVIAERFGTSQEYDIFLLAVSAPVYAHSGHGLGGAHGLLHIEHILSVLAIGVLVAVAFAGNKR